MFSLSARWCRLAHMKRLRHVPPDGILTVEQLKQRWGVSRNTVYNWIRSGLLKKVHGSGGGSGKRILVSERSAARFESVHLVDA